MTAGPGCRDPQHHRGNQSLKRRNSRGMKRRRDVSQSEAVGPWKRQQDLQRKSVQSLLCPMFGPQNINVKLFPSWFPDDITMQFSKTFSGVLQFIVLKIAIQQVLRQVSLHCVCCTLQLFSDESPFSVQVYWTKLPGQPSFIHFQPP